MCTAAPSGFSHIEKLISSRTKGAKHEYRKSVYLITNMSNWDIKTNRSLQTLGTERVLQGDDKNEISCLGTLCQTSQKQKKTWRSVSLIDITNYKAQKV